MCSQSTILRLVTSALLLSAVPLLPLSVSVSPAQAQPVLSTPLFQVEGVLEEGGTRLTEDDTLYAEHEFEGEAGQTITVVMESLEFDTYLLLRDPNGQIIAQNDDYAEGNANSVITIELPTDGSYTIVANAYDAQQKGPYTLTVLPGEDPIFSDLALRQAEAGLLNQQGVQQADVGEYQAALDLYKQALDIYLEIGDRRGEGVALNNIGSIYDSLGEYERALEYYERSLAIRQEVSDRRGEGASLNNIGFIYSNLGEYERALEYYERSLAIRQEVSDRRGEGVSLNNIGFIYSNLGEYERALEYYERSLAIRQEIGDRHGEGDSLNNIGSIHDSLGEYRRALEYYERSLAIRQEIGDRRGEGDSLNNIGSVYGMIGPYSEALTYHQQALVIHRELNNRGGEADTLNSIGWVYDGLGLYAESLESYYQALAIQQEIGDRRSEGITLGNIGSVYSIVGPYSEAINYHQQALAVHREVGNRETEGVALGNLGVIHSILGQYSQALDYQQQSLTLRREVGDREGEGSAINNIGSIYSSLGQPSQALEYYEEALIIFREISDRESEGTTLSNIGQAYNDLEQYPQALEYYQQALFVLKEIGYRAREGTTLDNIGNVHQILEQYPQALDYYQQALAIHREVGNRPNEGATLNTIGAIYRFLGEHNRSLDYHQQALTISREVGSLPSEANVFLSLGRLFDTQNQPELAITFYKQSINLTEQIRSNVQTLSPELQQSYTTTIEAKYRELADLLLQQNRVLEAQRVLDLLKIQELDEYLHNVRGTAQTESGIELLNPELELSNAIVSGQELATLYAIPYAERSETQQQRVLELEAQQDLIRNDFLAFVETEEIQTLIQQLSTDVQEQDVLTQMDEFANLQGRLQRLNQNAVLIYPLILDDRLELVVVTPFSEPVRYPVDVEREDLNEAVIAFRQALTDPDSDAIPTAQQLYDWLIAPMRADLEAIGAETILYAPDGVLRYVPLAALHDGDQWLTERFRVNHITAASLQNLTLEPTPQPQILAAAFSQGLHNFEVGQRDFSFVGLPFAGVEVENLVAAFPGTTQLLNDSFTLAETEAAMNSHTIVHLATHAAFVQGSPSESFILFGNGDRLTLQYINENWEGKLNRVNLVVLSACETGVGSATLGNGEEILGFGYLMQKAGAEAAIASLWSVNDGGTQVLMNAFYSALNQGMTKAEALRQAQMALISGDLTAVGSPRGNATIEFLSAETGLPPAISNNLNHPYYWAPFILIGNGL